MSQQSSNDEDGSLSMLKISSTNYLPIKKFSYSSYGLMTYILDKPIQPPLFVGSISIQSIEGTGVVAGYITQGSAPTKPGRVNLQVSRDIYAALLAVSTSAGAHSVQLTYDETTFAPVAITVS